MNRNVRVFKTSTNVELKVISSQQKQKYFNDRVIKYSECNVLRNELIKERDLNLKDFFKGKNEGSLVSPTRINFFSEKDVQKALLSGNILLTSHVQKRMHERGYSKADLLAAIWTSKRTELQYHHGSFKAILEGFDQFNNPICLSVGCGSIKFDKLTETVFYNGQIIQDTDFDFLSTAKLDIISVFPPTKDKFIRNVLHRTA